MKYIVNKFEFETNGNLTAQEVATRLERALTMDCQANAWPKPIEIEAMRPPVDLKPGTTYTNKLSGLKIIIITDGNSILFGGQNGPFSLWLPEIQKAVLTQNEATKYIERLIEDGWEMENAS
jgi:hypothetical protein